MRADLGYGCGTGGGSESLYYVLAPRRGSPSPLVAMCLSRGMPMHDIGHMGAWPNGRCVPRIRTRDTRHSHRVAKRKSTRHRSLRRLSVSFVCAAPHNLADFVLNSRRKPHLHTRHSVWTRWTHRNWCVVLVVPRWYHGGVHNPQGHANLHITSAASHAARPWEKLATCSEAMLPRLAHTCASPFLSTKPSPADHSRSLFLLLCRR